MDRIRDLVAAGGISVVLAQDRDRVAREPAYHYLLKKEFEERGCSIRALNDRGDDTPEGELTDGILDQLAKYERAKIAERSRRGKLRKAREGKLIAGPVATYGFKYNEPRDNYVVDERTMSVVSRIFYMLGVEGCSINAIKVAFDREGVSTPNGAAYWSHKAVRDCVLNDAYKAHTFEEIRELVTPEVASRMDQSRCYGIWWFNRRKTRSQQVSERGPDGVVYRSKQLATKYPKNDWIAVPVPDSGIRRLWVDAARDAIRDNRPTSAAGQRAWPLSGGLFTCGVCGRSMAAITTNRPNGKRYFYYHCPSRAQDGSEACRQTKYYVAEKIELGVWEIVHLILTNPEQLRDDLERMMDLERHGMREDPEREVGAWLDKLSEVDRKRARFQDMAADKLISFDELRAKIGSLEEIRETAEHELEVLKGRQERMAELERDKEALLETYTRMAPEKLEALTPEECRQLYKMLQLKVVACVDGLVEVEMPSHAVSTIDVSSSGLTQTPGTRRTKRSLVIPTTPTIGWTSSKAPGTSRLA
jgi:site-specific DNA recombinase